MLASGILACVGTRPNEIFDQVDAHAPALDMRVPADQAALDHNPDRAPPRIDGGFDLATDAPDVRPALPEMVGWWKLDEQLGTMALDSSGNGNHGVVEGLVPAQAWVQGRRAGAISFPPGTTAAGIRVALSPSLQALRRIMVAAWVRRLGADVAVESQSAIVSQQDDVEPRAESFSLVAYQEDLEAFIATSNADQTAGGGPLGVLSRGAGTREVWLHVAMTFDGSTLRLFRNGVELGAERITRPLELTSNPVYLGTNKNDHGSQPWEGLLDDIVICAEALPAAAIAALAADADPATVCGVRP